MTVQEAERLARETVEIMRGRIVNAVRFCEAYEGTDRTCVLDGSMYSPSSRALPNGERVWRASVDSTDPTSMELWEAFEDITSELESVEVPDGRTDSDCPDDWTVGWEDGCLFAYAPEYDQRD